ncbi:transposase [Burkholderia pseudomallei]|nr:transposase [Burkholderia pseudomallei]
MSLSNLIDEQLAIANVKRERFREILVRLMAYGVIVRDEDKTEQLLYDDARRVESLLDEYLDFAGFRLHHDRDNRFYRLYAAGAVVDGLPPDVYEPAPSLRARVSPDFVALALTLRFLYQNKLNAGDIQPQGEALVNFEEIAATMQTQLKRALPSSMGDKMALLAELRRHRLLRYAPEFSISDIVAYNPGQEEVQQGQRSGKSKRTLESFVVGAEYSRFSRPHGAHGYMAAVFRPGPDEDSAKTFTALVAASAQVDGIGERRVPKLERLELVIVDDAALTVDDFLKDAEQSEWVAVEEIVKRLKARYSKVVTYDGHKRDYLCALYGRFRGRISITWDEAQNAAKAWCQSIAYKKIGSVHDLVRDDILEYDGKQLQESITRISDLMRQVTNLKQEGQRLEATVGRLRGLKTAIAQTTSAFEEQVQYDLLLAKMLVAADDERIAQEQKRINDDSALVTRCEQKVKAEERLKAGVDRSRIDIAAKLSGIAANAEKERLDQQLELANFAARHKLAELNTGLQEAAQIVNAATGLLRKPIPEQFPKLKASVDAVGRVTASTDVARLDGLLGAVLDASSDAQLNVEKLFRLTPAFAGVEEGLAALHSYLVGTEDSVLMAVASETSELTQRVEATRKARKELADRKELLASGASDYNRDTRMALPRIRECLPEAGVQVLCDLVEPVSDEWQEAIEGYLDNARFNLIVKPEWEARTIDLLHSWGSRCKVIQGKRCLQRADAGRVPSDSIIHELRTDHPIARAYLIEQYGAVVKVRDSEQLRDTARGLTKDGKGSGSRTMFVGERRDLVLGRKAREQALRATIEKLDAADRGIREFEQLQDTLSSVKRLLGNLREPVFDAMPLGQAAGEIDSTRRSLAQLDLTEVEQLRAERAKLELLIAGHDAEITAVNKEITLASQRITDAQGAIERINGGRDARFREREDQIRRLGQMCETNSEKTYTVIAEEVEGLLKSRRFDVHSVQVRLNTLRAQPDKLLGDVREIEVWREYYNEARPHSALQWMTPAEFARQCTDRAGSARPEEPEFSN